MVSLGDRMKQYEVVSKNTFIHRITVDFIMPIITQDRDYVNYPPPKCGGLLLNGLPD